MNQFHEFFFSGGVHVLFPLLESAFSEIEDKETISYMSAREEESFTRVKSKRGRRKTRSGSQNPETDSWEMVPSSSFSDWKLEQNPISGFLTLVKNFVTNHTINLEQLMRGGGIGKCTQCGNYENLLSLKKYFVKLTP